MDGTARLVLYHLCWRYNDAYCAAWPSIARMCNDLDVPRRTVIDAINRLESAGLVRRNKGGGRGRSTRYQMPFIDLHRLNPQAVSTILWSQKQCGSPHRSEQATVRPTAPFEEKNSAAHRQKQCGPPPETVRPTAHEKKEINKKGRMLCASGGAGGHRTYEQELPPPGARTATDEAMLVELNKHTSNGDYPK